MSETIIKVEKLSKKYVIHHEHNQGKDALRDVIAASIKKLGNKMFSPFSRSKHDHEPSDEEFWALKDVSFEVKQGERIGIIGRNGAGKSTLLKLLSQITEPTTGRIEIDGRVASLLEVGTGFHQELSGRENIFMNGAILGMSKSEIKRKFDEIVAFAEIDKFLDTPVKRYSSGMYVRLAFAVAAHLEPEILIVDEVLAVGDAQFQKKCLGKMEEVGKEGRTVLFVSHNMGAVKYLCSKAILLKDGRIMGNGSVEQIAGAYANPTANEFSAFYFAKQKKSKPHFKSIKLEQAGHAEYALAMDRPIKIKFEIETCNQQLLVVGLTIRNAHDQIVHHSTDEFRSEAALDDPSKRECELPSYALANGKYYVDVRLALRNVETFEELDNVISFNVDFTGIMSDKTAGSNWKGVCGPGFLKWQ